MNNENVTTNDWRWAWKLGKPRFLAVAGLVAAAIVLLPAFWRARKHRDWLRLFAAPLLALAIIAVAAKGKSTYLFFIVPWLLAAVAGQLAQHSKGGRLTCLASGTLACAGIFVGSTPFAFERFVLINADADQRPAAAFARLAAEIPPNSTILTTGDSWAAVARANHVFDANAAGPEVAERIDCIVLTGNWSGVPGMPKPLREPFATMLATQFQLVDNHCARQPPTAFGKRLSNSAFGFGTAVFRRIDPIKRGQ